MGNWTEKFGDFAYAVARIYVQIRTGRPTAVEKSVRVGPIVNGGFRPDLPDQPGSAIFEAFRTGESVNVQKLHVREVRRRIVFLDPPES